MVAAVSRIFYTVQFEDACKPRDLLETQEFGGRKG
jgi:hypothetical protein